MASRLDKLRARRIDPGVVTKGLNEVYARIQLSEAAKYAIGAMQPVDPAYTANTLAQGDRVKEQLENRLQQRCDYRYQGSVTNDTHIRALSDIDLLALTRRYYRLMPPLRPSVPYTGNPVQDLQDLRAEIIKSLKDAFPAATVTATGNKSVPIEGGSLTRKVDVVPADWCDTTKYRDTGLEMYRGVEVLDNSVPELIFNTPFFHNAMLEQKDRTSLGGMRKAARLMKSLKYDADNMDLSSFDIVAIAYNMDAYLLQIDAGRDLAILGNCLQYCLRLEADAQLRDGIRVPDGHRRVFEPGHASVKGLKQLISELAALADDVLQENRRSFQKLAEARVEY